MTTVAWDGSTLAGDTSVIVGNTLMQYGIKIFRLKHGRLYGGSGRREDCLAVLQWLNEEVAQPKVEDFAGIVIDVYGKCWRLEDRLIFMPIEEPFHAVGSGRDFAIAAMDLGKTAEEAVALAAKYDPYTGGAITTIKLKGDTSGPIR